jgi:hypothetical protein
MLTFAFAELCCNSASQTFFNVHDQALLKLALPQGELQSLRIG